MTNCELTTMSRAYVQAFNRNDAAGVAGYFTEAGSLLPPDCRPLQGPQAIQTFWQAVFDMGITQIELHPEEVELEGNLACERGRYVLCDSLKWVCGAGYYVVVWRRTGGAWKRHHEMFSRAAGV